MGDNTKMNLKEMECYYSD